MQTKGRSMHKKKMVKKIMARAGVAIVASEEYTKLLEHVKKDIQQTQLKASMSIAKELTLLYWRIGKALAEKIKAEKWGTKVIEKLAHDLLNSFPGIVGFSRTNIYRMMAFHEAYPNCPTAVGQLEENAILMIPWGHNVAMVEKLQDIKQRLWYAKKTLENGWSRATLAMWIESDLYSRQGKAITNFKVALPQPYSDLAEQTLKDPYIFDFLTMDTKAREQEIEQGLMAHIQKFLLELGQGFAFIGRQYHIQVGNKDFFIDLLFYHVTLRCFVVVELKADEFEAQNIGQINLYLSAIDSTLKHSDDQPTIGLLLCKTKDNYVAEYALRDLRKPIGIASYKTKLVESLPKNLKGSLPTIQEIETELAKHKPSGRRRSMR
jgi:predicted nuclease of restriction endonuclease-like (RecB) superfamily